MLFILKCAWGEILVKCFSHQGTAGTKLNCVRNKKEKKMFTQLVCKQKVEMIQN